MALIILAHPTFEKSIANKTIIEELQKSDVDLEIRNIHSLYPDYNIDVNKEQEALLRHQTIVFQYPFYWYNMPAILKHWFDEVFTYKFAYGTAGDKLKNKNFVPSFTIGASKDDYHTLGEAHFPVYEYCKNMEQTAYYAQMNYVAPFYTHGTSLVAGNTIEEVENNARIHAGKLMIKLEELK